MRDGARQPDARPAHEQDVLEGLARIGGAVGDDPGRRFRGAVEEVVPVDVDAPLEHEHVPVVRAAEVEVLGRVAGERRRGGRGREARGGGERFDAALELVLLRDQLFDSRIAD
jgi:hypothetical protein